MLCQSGAYSANRETALRFSIIVDRPNSATVYGPDSAERRISPVYAKNNEISHKGSALFVFKTIHADHFDSLRVGDLVTYSLCKQKRNSNPGGHFRPFSSRKPRRY